MIHIGLSPCTYWRLGYVTGYQARHDDWGYAVVIGRIVICLLTPWHPIWRKQVWGSHDR